MDNIITPVKKSKKKVLIIVSVVLIIVIIGLVCVVNRLQYEETRREVWRVAEGEIEEAFTNYVVYTLKEPEASKNPYFQPFCLTFRCDKFVEKDGFIVEEFHGTLRAFSLQSPVNMEVSFQGTLLYDYVNVTITEIEFDILDS